MAARLLHRRMGCDALCSTMPQTPRRRKLPSPPPSPPLPAPAPSNAGKEFTVYAGREVAQALARDSVKPGDCTSDLSGLTADELARLDQQEAAYASKYEVVGQVCGLEGCVMWRP